jgi:hypothetical protein
MPDDVFGYWDAEGEYVVSPLKSSGPWCDCGQPLWAAVSVERGYCEACRLAHE